jgi:hypothetical protein
MSESRQQFRVRLYAEGRYGEFVAWREEEKAKGRDAKGLWKDAVALFPPLNGDVVLRGPTHAEAHAGAPPVVSTAAERTIYESLALAARNRTATPYRAVEWALENIPLPLDEIDPDSVPSSLAIGCLERGRKDHEFYKRILPNFLPNKVQLEAENRFADDGRELDDLCGRVIAAGDEAEADAIVAIGGIVRDKLAKPEVVLHGAG